MKKKISPKRNRDLEFLFEISSLRFVERSWVQFLHTNVASISEHIFTTIWIALLIAKHEKAADTGRIVKMALVHDITESRTGDAHYLSRQYVERNEDLAIRDMLAGTALEEEFVALWREHEEKKTIEARIVKDADNLDVDLALRELKDTNKELYNSFSPSRSHAVYKLLYTKTAKRLWKAIQKADPNDWHSLGRNRFLDGDWKKSRVQR
jgi:putative hydrolase of HD superfamily